MAIRVQTSATQQSTAPAAQTFGYQEPNTSGFDAVARTLAGTASQLGQTKRFLESEERRKKAEQKQFEADDRRRKAEFEQLQAKRKRKQDAADNIKANKWYTDWSTGLQRAEQEHVNALSLGDEEKIKATGLALDEYNTDSPNFAPDLNLNNKNYLADEGFLNRASTSWNTVQLKRENNENTFETLNFFDGEAKRIRGLYHSLSIKNPNSVLGEDDFNNVYNSWRTFAEDNRLGVLTNTAADGQRSKSARGISRLFQLQFANSLTTEQVDRNLKKLEAGFGSGELSFMSDAQFDALRKKAASAKSEIISSDNARLKDELTSIQQVVTNGAGNLFAADVTTTIDSASVLQYNTAAIDVFSQSEQTSNVLTDEQVQQNRYNLVITDYMLPTASGVSKLQSAAMAALSSKDVDLSKEEDREMILTKSLEPILDDFELPNGQKVALTELLTPTNYKKLTNKIVEVAEYIQDEALDNHNAMTVGINLFGKKFYETEFQSAFYAQIGVKDAPPPRLAPTQRFSFEDADLVSFMTQEVTNNHPEGTHAAGFSLFHNPKGGEDAPAKEEQIVQGFLMMSSALSGLPADQAVAKAQDFVNAYRAHESFEEENSDLKKELYSIYEEMGGSLFDLIGYYNSADVAMYDQAEMLETFTKGRISQLVDRDAGNLSKKLASRLEEKGELSEGFLEKVFAGGVFRKLKKELRSLEPLTYGYLGTVSKAPSYEGVKHVAVFPQILEEFNNFKLGGLGGMEASRNFIKDALGESLMLSQQTLGNNIFAITIDELVSQRDNLLIENSQIEALRQNGVTDELLNALRAEDIEDVELSSILVDATVRNQAGNRVPLFLADEYRLKNGQPELVLKVYSPRTNKYMPVVMKDKSMFRVGQETLLQELRGMSAYQLYTTNVLAKLGDGVLTDVTESEQMNIDRLRFGRVGYGGL